MRADTTQHRLIESSPSAPVLIEAPADPLAPEPELPEWVDGRYRRIALLGRGGMGSVWRVEDSRLQRHLALKVVRSDRASPADLGRFEDEARLSAGLQHPGLVPVHDFGVLPDGRPWFAMQEVHGTTLDARIAEAHRSWRLGAPGEGSLRRLLEAFVRACEAVAYAHARGVVHRDLKPANVMLGDHGSVFVLDWGLAKLGRPGPDHEGGGPTRTRSGAIAGTPAYLSPEQARGLARDVTARSDVYALGATLYDLLCDRPPRLARTVDQLVGAIARGLPFRPPSELARGLAADDALDRICCTALATDPAERYPDAGPLATELAAWLDGARNRERAARWIAEADGLVAEARAERAAADQDLGQARALLATLPADADPSDKRGAWACEDRARAREASARHARTGAIQTLRSALSLDPEAAPAHARLAELFHEVHRGLEADHRPADAEGVAADLRRHDRERRYAAYLSGIAAITLHTTVPVEARLHRLVERDRRLVPELERSLGPTPLTRSSVPMGRWLVTLHRPGHAVVRYPVQVERGEHWHGVPPDASDPLPIAIPLGSELGPDECYVPAGWFWSGDDEYEHTAPLRRRWADGFVIGRFPVTVAEYVAYLDALSPEEADRAQPRLGDADDPLYARDGAGRFVGIRQDRDGDGWERIPRAPDTPATCVDWHQARAYAGWLAAEGRRPWRLPMEGEWQKAARGADQRLYPWGDHFEPTWCRMVMSADRTMIVPVSAYPADESPYGVRGLAGNVADWLADGVPEPPGHRDDLRVRVRDWEATQRLAAGGTCGGGPRTCRTSQRARLSAAARTLRNGFRLVRSFG